MIACALIVLLTASCGSSGGSDGDSGEKNSTASSDTTTDRQAIRDMVGEQFPDGPPESVTTISDYLIELCESNETEFLAKVLHEVEERPDLEQFRSAVEAGCPSRLGELEALAEQ